MAERVSIDLSWALASSRFSKTSLRNACTFWKKTTCQGIQSLSVYYTLCYPPFPISGAAEISFSLSSYSFGSIALQNSNGRPSSRVLSKLCPNELHRKPSCRLCATFGPALLLIRCVDQKLSLVSINMIILQPTTDQTSAFLIVLRRTIQHADKAILADYLRALFKTFLDMLNLCSSQVDYKSSVRLLWSWRRAC